MHDILRSIFGNEAAAMWAGAIGDWAIAVVGALAIMWEMGEKYRVHRQFRMINQRIGDLEAEHTNLVSHVERMKHRVAELEPVAQTEDQTS